MDTGEISRSFEEKNDILPDQMKSPDKKKDSGPAGKYLHFSLISVGFYSPINCSNLNPICSNLLGWRNLQP